MVHHIVTVVLDPEAGLDLVRKDVIPTSVTPLIKLVETSLRSAGDATCKVSGLTRLPADFGGQVVIVVFRVATILATKVIL